MADEIVYVEMFNVIVVPAPAGVLEARSVVRLTQPTPAQKVATVITTIVAVAEIGNVKTARKAMARSAVVAA